MEKYLRSILILTVVIGFFFNSMILNAEVKNEDKPLKGNWDFKLRKLWEINSAGDQILTQIVDIKEDEDGRIFVMERQQNKFFVFDQNAKFLYSFGNRGEGPGEYKLAFSFFLKGQYVIVPDQDRSHYFNKDGKYIKSYSYGTVVFPRAQLDEFRFLVMRDNDDEKVQLNKLEIFDLNSMKYTPIAEISSEKTLDAHLGRMRVKFKDASTTPMVIITENNNEIYFGKNDQYFIKKIDTNGKELLSFSISGREKKKISEKLKRERFENARSRGNAPSIPKEVIDQMVKSMPDYCTYYNYIDIDKKGLIYIYLNDFANKTAQEIDIFSPGGKYLFHGNIQLPQGLKSVTPLRIKKTGLIVFVEDEEGEQELVKFQVEAPPSYE
ncbi:MAG TPA: 6-bladed beta-propeller [Candidatus Kapabacteria bacterium]|nr:6-bladed beta-propeller [Candidatus Kapabacteria bacterium]